MNISNINSTSVAYKQQNQNDKTQYKPEFIDKFTQAIKNPRDVQDCVAVPRGIFKAYLFIIIY